MVLEDTIKWIIVTIIFSIIIEIKNYYYKKNVNVSKELEVIKKTKEIYIKTVDQQKDYIRAKTSTGKDFIDMVFSIMLFYLGFIILIKPKLTNFGQGIFAAISFALVFSVIYANFMIDKKYLRYNLIDSFLNKVYIGIFIVYVMFKDTIHSILLLILSIVVMIGINYLSKKLKGDKNDDKRKSSI